ncbi:MAG: hypothetical protein ACI4BB_03585 [Coprococcus sp.]
MPRMEIALFLVLAFVAFVYFSAGRKQTPLHKAFYILLIAMLIHLTFDAATIYTVNYLDTIRLLLNDILHRFFIGTMVLIVYLFYQYISILVEEEAYQAALRPGIWALVHGESHRRCDGTFIAAYE